MCKLMQSLSTFQGNKPIRLPRCLSLYGITLNTINSYSYRVHCAIDRFILCHCAEPPKSPTIGQLQEIRAIGVVIWRDSCIQLTRPTDALSTRLAEYHRGW